jgi:hypothetical protein
MRRRFDFFDRTGGHSAEGGSGIKGAKCRCNIAFRRGRGGIFRRQTVTGSLTGEAEKQPRYLIGSSWLPPTRSAVPYTSSFASCSARIGAADLEEQTVRLVERLPFTQ